MIAVLERALREWDDAYLTVLRDLERDHEKTTEERLKLGTRNELRQRGVELPEIARWRLRAAIGFRSEEDL